MEKLITTRGASSFIAKPLFKYLLLFFIFLSTGLLASAQSDTSRLTSIVTKLEKLSTTHPVEKVYLHLNKPGYNLGDTIWMKGYVTVGPHHQPSALSGILYIELIDGKDKVIKTLMLKSENGIAFGDLPVKAEWLPGSYRLRAYTAWMRNAAPDYFFNQALVIGDVKANSVFVNSSFGVKNKGGDVIAELAYTDKLGRAYDRKQVDYELRTDTVVVVKGKGITDEHGILHLTFADKALVKQQLTTHIKILGSVVVDKAIPVNLQNGTADLQFFPEGGQLVNGVRSKVAFKAIGISGLGLPVSGIITDNDSNEVAAFNAQHAGMGVFALTPVFGKTYSAKVTFADNSTMSVNLPVAVEKAFVLAVNNSDSAKISVRIATNDAVLKEKQNSVYYLVGQSGGVVYYTAAIKLDNADFKATIAKNRFPAGIAQFTLFSAAMEPLNERVVFINNAFDLLSLGLSAIKPVYAGNEKIDLDFLAKQTGTNLPVAGSFSVAVYNENKTVNNENSESTILSNLLLTSDLKGYVEQPNYYFKKPNEQTNADLDVLMLTQGYRRFDWTEVMASRYPAITYQPERSLNISGIITTPSGKPIANGKISVLSTLDAVTIDTVSDVNGHFVFKAIEFPDSTKLVIKARKANDGKNVSIALEDNRTVPLIYKANIADASLNLSPPFFNRNMMVAAAADLDNAVAEKADTVAIAAVIKENTVTKGNQGKQLKVVDIKQKKVDKPDKSNLWGATTPNLVIKGYELIDYATIIAGIGAKIRSGSFEKNGKLYDAIVTATKGPIPIPIVINDFLQDSRKELSDMITVDQIEDVKIMRGNGIKAIYGIDPFNPNDNVIVITTKAFAGTDTSKMERVNIASTQPGKQLKEVNIKQQKIQKPDQSNVWGTVKPDKIITGDQMRDNAMTYNGLVALIPTILLKDGHIYDANPLIKLHAAKDRTLTKDDFPIPIVLNGFAIRYDDDIDALVSTEEIEDVRVMRGNEFKSIYGIKSTNPNDRVIVITTKAFAGTDTSTAKQTKVAALNHNLQQVNIKSRKNARTELAPWAIAVEGSANLNGPGMANQVITADELNGCMTLGECLQSKIPGIITKGGNYYFAIHQAQSVMSPPPIVFIIDGQLIAGAGSVDVLNSLIVSNVKAVEVLKSSSYLNIYGQNASGGALVITTKKGSIDDNNTYAFKDVPGIIYTTFNGFQKSKQFYMPKYALANPVIIPDNRDAVYWNPYLTTDSSGKCTLEFYNSNVKGTYKAVVEGIDNDGHIGRFVYRYRVK